MKLLSSFVLFIGIDGNRYEICVEKFKTVTHVYYKKVKDAYWSNVIRLKGKDRDRPIRDIIIEDLNS